MLAYCCGFTYWGIMARSGEYMPRLWAKTVNFDSVSPGDGLPILVKWETEETIQRFKELVSRLDPPAVFSNEPANETANEPAAETAEAAVATTGQPALIWGMALTAYVAELLEKAFKLPNIVAKGSQLELEILKPVNPGDTLVLSGSVVDKRVDQELRLVECRVIIENQSGETVASATATVSM